jgi:hypothetical protein
MGTDKGTKCPSERQYEIQMKLKEKDLKPLHR